MARLRICFVLVLASCASVRPTRTELSAPTVTIPIALVNHMPIVSARLDGGAAWSALFDTGAGGLVVTPRRAHASGLVTTPRRFSVTGVDGKQERVVPVAPVARLELPGVVVSDVLALSVEELALFAQTLGVAVDGLVAPALFGPRLVTLDYDAHTLVIAAGALDEHDPDVLPARFELDTPHVVVSVAGAPLEVVLDSGCSGWLQLPAALEARVPLVRPAIPGAKHASINGVARDRIARMDGELRIGDHVLVDPPIDFSTGEARLCAQVLRYFTMTLDASHARVRLHAATPHPIAVDAERTAGLGLLKRDGAWVVADLIPGLAPAGVELEDVIVTIEGQPAATLTREELKVLQRADTLRLSLLRRGQRLDVTIPVREVGTF